MQLLKGVWKVGVIEITKSRVESIPIFVSKLES